MSVILRRKLTPDMASSFANLAATGAEPDITMNYSSELEPPKKKRFRAKLDHLTQEQKLERRKEKNRIAAQTARDRKRTTMELLRMENRRKEAENRRKDKEIELLKAQIKLLTQGQSNPMPVIKSEIIDSGISETSDSNSKTISMSEGSEMDMLLIPQLDTSNRLRAQSTDGSSTSGAFSASPIPDSYIDSMVGDEIDEEACIDEILELEKSVYSEQGNAGVVGSAAPICELLPRARDIACRSLSVENSAGWTSIQLMLLLLITRIHRLYSGRINCCAMSHNDLNLGNLYDYIQQSSCAEYKRAAESIISTKDNIQHQRLVALEFVYMYVYNDPLFRRLRNNQANMPSC